MGKAIAWLAGFLVKGATVKFTILTALYALIALVVPFAVKMISKLIDPSGLTNAFSGLPSGVWYFLDLFRLDFGLPLALAAVIGRFLIRRLPVIG